MSRPVLYDYWRSSASYRVRIALNLKGIDYDSRQVDLRAGDQQSDEYRAVNPQGFVPMLEIDGHRLTQSLAIINYLDLKYPNQPLLPASAADRAHVVAMARPQAGKFLFGDGPTGADVLLVPQLYNARRYDVPLGDYPTLLRAEENANKLDAFAEAHPDRQQVEAPNLLSTRP